MESGGDGVEKGKIVRDRGGGDRGGWESLLKLDMHIQLVFKGSSECFPDLLDLLDDHESINSVYICK